MKHGSEARASAYLDVIEEHLKANGPLLLGDKLSAADFYLVMLARWARPMANPPHTRPNIAKLLDKVTALPSVDFREELTLFHIPRHDIPSHHYRELREAATQMWSEIAHLQVA